jgi:hypothetical protein
LGDTLYLPLDLAGAASCCERLPGAYRGSDAPGADNVPSKWCGQSSRGLDPAGSEGRSAWRPDHHLPVDPYSHGRQATRAGKTSPGAADGNAVMGADLATCVPGGGCSAPRLTVVDGMLMARRSCPAISRAAQARCRTRCLSRHVGKRCYSPAVDRTHRESLAYLLSSSEQLPPRRLNAALREIWPRLHGPLHQNDPTAMVNLFKRAGYVTDGVLSPTASLTVYRGEPVSGQSTGISWTTDRQTAMTYARGYSTVSAARVIQAVASPGVCWRGSLTKMRSLLSLVYSPMSRYWGTCHNSSGRRRASLSIGQPKW